MTQVLGTQSGAYAGTLPADVYAGRVTLTVLTGTGDSVDDPDNLPDLRTPQSATLVLTPSFHGFGKLSDGSVVILEPQTYTSEDGKFDFYCIDGTSPGLNPSGWNWTAALITELGSTSFVFQPNKDTVTVLGDSLPLQVADGVPVIQGPAPTITWDGTRIVVDGVAGPDLQGASGTGGTNTPGPAPSGLTLTSPAQGSLTATWDAVPDAVRYTVTLDAGTPETVSGTTKTWSNLSPASEHTVSVHGVLGLPTQDATGTGTVQAAPATPPLQTAILADSPNFYWPFDDAPGTAAPRQLGSGTSAIEAVQTPELTGHSSTFYKGDDCWAVDKAVIDGVSAFTMEAVIAGTPNNDGAWFSNPNGLTAYYDTSNGLGAQLNTTDAADNFVFKNWYSAPDTARHHVAIRWDGGAVQFYLDGVPSQYGPYTLKGALVPNTGNNCWIGAAAGFACGLEISDVAIWHSALTPSQIAAHAAAM